MIVLRNRDQFLLLKRAKMPHQGKYVPVGGKVEPYEDPYSAAKRELYEETGIRLEALSYCGVLVETAPLDYNWQCNIYVADIDYMSPPPCDEGILEWIPFLKVPEVSTPKTDWHIYQFIMKNRVFAINAIYDKEMELISMVEEIQNEQLV